MLVATMWVSGSALAATFTPYQCSACDTWTSVSPWVYNASSGYSVWDQPQDPNCSDGDCPHYINWLYDKQYFVANQYVEKVQFNISQINLESGFDSFSYGVPGDISSLTGSPSATWYGKTTNGEKMSMLLYTDQSVTKPGIYIDQVRVCCRGTSGSTQTLEPTVRYHGALLAASDTVYLQNTSLAGLSDHIGIALDASGSKDFDLYVRCNALPTPSTYDYRSFGSDATEYVHIGANYCAAGTIYVAVNSYSGTGDFNLYATRHPAANHWSLKAGTSFTATSSEVTAMYSILQRSARLLWGASEGAFSVDQVDVWNNGSCNNCGGAACDICLNYSSNLSLTYVTCGQGNPGTSTNLNTTSWTSGNVFSMSWTMVHEYMHLLPGLCDEYGYDNNNNIYYSCSHSILGNLPLTGLRSLCNYDGGSWMDHSRDKVPTNAQSKGEPNWPYLATYGYTNTIPTATADQLSYYDNDVDYHVGVV